MRAALGLLPDFLAAMTIVGGGAVFTAFASLR
jgi:hypothetical protein